MPLGVDETLHEIGEIHRRLPIYHHQLFTDIMEGTLSRAQLKEKVKQEGIIPLHNHNYHGRLYVICPDPKWRSRIAEVCYEEGAGKLYAGGVPHSELYLRLGAALGADRDEMMNTRYCAGALGFRSYFSEICGRNFLEGVSSHMLASEAPVPEYSHTQAEALKKHYGLTDYDVTFQTVHEVADTDHANVGRELLSEFAHTEEDFRLVLRTVEETCRMMILMHDDIYRTVREVH